MKKILIIATAILVFILIMIAAINSMMRRANNPGQTIVPTPTTAPFTSSPINPTQPQISPSNSTGVLESVSSDIIEAGKTSTPYETESFRFEYSEANGGFIVTEKTVGGLADYEEWITTEEGLPELSKESQAVTIVSVSATGEGKVDEEYDSLIEFFNTLFLPLDTRPQPTSTPTPAPQSSNRNNNNNNNRQTNVSSNAPIGQGGYTYYAQCNGYGKISLPGGCNLCDAGCGPTTVAMIAASYLGKDYNPKTIVDLYDDKGYYLSCAGSRYSDAKSALESLGLKTTSYLIYDLETADNVASDFKKYLDAGWTIFTLANYCDKGCGHYFWVTEVKNGDILAYDPFYGKSTKPPYNENARYPFPKYRVAFGVKK